MLASIDEFEPDRELIRAPRLQGPAALLARMGALNLDDDLGDLDYQTEIAPIMRGHLVRVVGDQRTLDDLDDRPLVVEEFGWDEIPADVHERVREVLTLTEACCTDLLDEQYRVVTRRLLADIAAADPAIFRRNSRADTAAAAICWIAGSANALFDHSPVKPKLTYVKDLFAYFGLKPTFSADQRAQPMLRAIGVDPYARHGSSLELDTPRYLTADHRGHLIELRARYR